MRRSPVFLSVLFLLLCESLPAQVRHADGREDDHDAFGKRLESMIDGFLRDLSHESSPAESDMDTIPPVSNSEREGEDIDQWRKPGASIAYDGDVVVQEEETVRANLVVKGGDLTVFGTVEGDVLVVGGTLYVRDGGTITGNARVINGDIVKDEGGTIDGYSDRTTASTAGYRYSRGRFSRDGYRFRAPWADELTNLDNLIYRFNRVEGHFFGLGSEKKYYWNGDRGFSSYGSVGWGFKSHRWRYLLGVERQFSLSSTDDDAGQILEFGLRGYSLTDSKEGWIIATNENTGAAILIHEDFHDYYGRDGFEAHTAYYYQDPDVTAQLKVGFVADRYESLENRTEWSIFGGKKIFRLNPAVHEGAMRSFVIRPGLSTVDKTSRGDEGWNIVAVAEIADRSFGGDFSFSQIVADVRRYQPLSRYDGFNIRLRVGTSGGTLPVQRSFDIGGLGTLHARSYKSEREANRLILVNAEYVLNGDFLNDLDFWPSGLLRRVNFILMGDAAYVRTEAPESGWTEGFDAIRLADFRSDLGVGLSNRAGSFRMGFAWRTDIKAPARFFFRFTRPF